MKAIYNYVKANVTLLIAIITGYSYFLTFQFERGISDYLGIPNELIEISIKSLIIFSSSIFIGIVGIIQFISVAGSFSLIKLNNWKIKLAGLLASIAVLLSTASKLFFQDPTKIYPVAKLPLFMSIILLLIEWIIIIIKKKPNNEDEGKIIYAKKLTRPRNPMFGVIMLVFFSGFIFLILPVLCYMMGGNKAAQQKSYFKLNGDTAIVLREYGDKLICRGYLPTTNVVTEKIIIINLSRVNESQLNSNKVLPTNLYMYDYFDKNLKQTLNDLN